MKQVHKNQRWTRYHQGLDKTKADHFNVKSQLHVLKANNMWPTGTAYLEYLIKSHHRKHDAPFQAIHGSPAEMDLLGSALSAMHQIAMCYPSCTGGPHILQALVGRVYNHGVASAGLAAFGFYDESLNLTRSMGEASNLLLLFLESHDEYRSWCEATSNQRWKQFKPSIVRKKLMDKGSPVPMDEQVYSYLCEIATHVNPSTRPNAHASTLSATGIIGGLYEAEGAKKAFSQLTETATAAALIITKRFSRDDLSSQIEASFSNLKQEQDDSHMC